jgi:phosphoribosylformylglycinamidine (FGAM) synthase PurS component
MAEDIVDELEARGDPLSIRAARYIRIKRNTEEGLERELRRMCQKSLARESSEYPTDVK